MDSVIRGVSIYVILLIATRLSGRRTMAQMTPFDFVLLLIIALALHGTLALEKPAAVF